MVNTRLLPIIGIVGGLSAFAGLVSYTFAPEKLWLVTVCEGLAFVCLSVFFIANLKTLKAFSTRRSTRLGLNSILAVLLLVGILTIANFLAARHAPKWDLSETQRFTLAPQTYQILRGLNQDIRITVFSHNRSPGFLAYRDLLESYTQESARLIVKFVDPEQDPGLARQYNITRLDIAVFETPSQSVRITSPSEAELTAALIRVSKGTKKRIVFLEGHGERALANHQRTGYAQTKEILVNQGYDVQSFSFREKDEIPRATSVLVIAGPRQALTPNEQSHLGAFVKAGGHVLVLIDPETQSNIAHLIAGWGITLGDGIVVDEEHRIAQGSPTALLVRTFTEHEITHNFNLPILLPVSQHIMFDEERGQEWEFTPLAHTSPKSWVETNLTDDSPSFDAEQDTQGPLILAATLSPKNFTQADTREPAIVIIGNSTFANNAYLNFPGNTDFLLHTVAWLAEERDLISITPKDPAFEPFVPNPTQEQLLLFFQVLFLPILILFMGVAVWRKRRRL